MGGYGRNDSALALIDKDDARPDVYVRMQEDPANAPLLPLPTVVPPPPLVGVTRDSGEISAPRATFPTCLPERS